MRMSEVRAKARLVGVDPGRMKKAELICAIQKGEGFVPCFGMGKKECPYTDCCFRSDCMFDLPSSLQEVD